MVSSDLQLPELARIPAGEFLMGSNGAEEDERPPHQVFVDEFLIGIYPVTNREYARFVQLTGHRAPAIYELPIVVTAGARDREQMFKSAGEPYVWTESDPPHTRLDHPVTLVRWEDAVAYCAWLAAETGRAVRLPTEAEWEKAARGGLDGARFPWGSERPTTARFDGPGRVMDSPPNALGLVALSGVCHEWCLDWEDPGYYAVSPERNPAGPSHGSRRVSRGGAWRHQDPWSPVAHRSSLPPDLRYSDYGFRVVRVPES